MLAGPFDRYRRRAGKAPAGRRLQLETGDAPPDDAPVLLGLLTRAPPGEPHSAAAAAGCCSPAAGRLQESRAPIRRAGTQCPRMPGCRRSGDPLTFAGRAAAALRSQGRLCSLDGPQEEKQLQAATSRR